jgi:hypothetical protein
MLRPMNHQVELNLALILFLPWYLILAGLFWIYPRAPAAWARRGFDFASLALAILAAAAGTYWGFNHADPGWGGMWKQVLATSLSYGLFLGVLTLAVLVRWRLLRAGRLGAVAGVRLDAVAPAEQVP